jgi:hypothetical protein
MSVEMVNLVLDKRGLCKGRRSCIVVMWNNSGPGGDITKEVVVKESTSDRRGKCSLETI